ncbi:MAG: bifunctional demethylmenaquinone methyltransferase/2-methoxy-6-polyprenyl-1,4-benzoquinol methylase UbiE [Calditrichia bacterium]
MEKKWFFETEAEQKKKFVRSMFNNISDSYDLMNRLMSFGIDLYWRKKTITRLLDNKNMKLVLDLACGTGDLTWGLLKKNNNASVVMADFSENMLLNVRKRKGFEYHKNAVMLCQADGEVLPFDDEKFDGAMIAFGIRNIPDPAKALSEFYRTLKKGGRLVILEITTSPYKWFDILYRFYFHKIVPVLGSIVSGNRKAYAYLPQSVDYFIKPDAMVQMMEKVGFTNIQVNSLTLGSVHLYSGEKNVE